uniref:Core shell protein Gag P30 domain-containing protein n=1 Tax=Rousettus aegyptiacus TaxID=9407 RepID=A0A7J8IM84_ROUAE|nr:hypothetical protein HJG63_010528 [Rousettus aegyptiacus]
MIYMPFSMSDLHNWKAQNPPFSEKPQALMGLLESVFQTHCPTWDDHQQLLITPFTAEERGHIWTETKEEGRRVEEVGEQIEDEFPSTCPDWGHDSQAGRTALNRCRQILTGVTGWPLVSQLTFLRQLKLYRDLRNPLECFLNKAYPVDTPIDPEAPENQRAINTAFATQATSDIRRKLQKLEGFARMNLSQLVEIAQKVFNNREAPDDPKPMAKIQNYCHQLSQSVTRPRPRDPRS